MRIHRSGAARVVAGGAAPDLDEGVLHQLFCFGVVAQHAARDSEGAGGEALVEFCERTLIAADDAVEESLIVQFSQARLQEWFGANRHAFSSR